jgi:hypothetical protein
MAVVVGLCAFGAQNAAATPFFVNGNFEAGVGAAFGTHMTAANTPGWTFSAGGAFPENLANKGCGGTYGAGNQGCNYALLGGTEDGGTSFIEQTLAGFTVGDTYTLSWLQSSEFTTKDKVNASIIGGGTLSMDFSSDPYPGGSQFWEKWQTMTLTFAAAAPTLTFHFHSYAVNDAGQVNYEPGLDDFKITGNAGAAAVPEPASLILLGTGVIGTGIKRLRRRKSA